MRRTSLVAVGLIAVLGSCSSPPQRPTPTTTATATATASTTTTTATATTTTTTSTTTTTAPASPSVVAVAGGSAHTCALRADGTVWCWGSNLYGQLGFATNSGTTTATPTPSQVTGVTGAIGLTAGGDHSCAVLSDGQLTCWGWNYFGQLGSAANNNTNTPSPVATVVSGLTGVVGVAGGDNHTCAWTGSGTVSCFGDNQSAALGNSTNSGVPAANPVPAEVAGVTGATDVVASDRFTCAVVTGAQVMCWGVNNFGQMGNSTNLGSTAANLPATVSGVSGVAELAAGSNHVCARTTVGALWCWGLNVSGQLGTTTNIGTTTPNTAPLASAVTSGADELAAGDYFTCSRSGGTVSCWGNNYRGQLGTTTNSGATTPNPSPTVVAGVTGATALGTGPIQTCAASASLQCWGLNYHGQLGHTTNIGTTTPNPTPTVVAGL